MQNNKQKRGKLQTKRRVCVLGLLPRVGRERAHEIWRKRECDVARARVVCVCRGAQKKWAGVDWCLEMERHCRPLEVEGREVAWGLEVVVWGS